MNLQVSKKRSFIAGGHVLLLFKNSVQITQQQIDKALPHSVPTQYLVVFDVGLAAPCMNNSKDSQESTLKL